MFQQELSALLLDNIYKQLILIKWSWLVAYIENIALKYLKVSFYNKSYFIFSNQVIKLISFQSFITQWRDLT